MKSYLKEIQAEQRTMIIADGGTCNVTIIQKQGYTCIQRPPTPTMNPDNTETSQAH